VSGTARLGRHRALLAALSVGVLAAVLIAVLASRSVSPGTVETSALGGKYAPAISGTDIRTGKPVSLQALRGRYVVVNFFASWCQPCETETRPLVAFLFAHHAAHNAAILGVTFSDSATNARAFLTHTGATWPAVADPDGAIAVRYGVGEPPESFIVGPDGKVIAAILGGVTEAALDEVVPTGGSGAT
jgi:cytochrome c biogenesis protein CcmG/thiol:disulfide interchange protein DsbE